MKLKKILSAAAAVAVTGAIAVSASAGFQAVEDPAEGLSIASGLYMVPIFCDGTATDIVATDYELDLSKIGYASFTFTIPETTAEGESGNRDFYDGGFGGGAGVSIHMSNIPQTKTTEDHPELTEEETKNNELWDYYNWPAQQFWGVCDVGAKNPNAFDIDGNYMEEEAALSYLLTRDIETYENDAFVETLAPYTYRVQVAVPNPVVDGVCTADQITDFRIYLQGWGSWNLYETRVTRSVVLDTDGKVMIAFDEKGNVVDGTADDENFPTEMEAPPEEDPIWATLGGGDDASAADDNSTATSDAASAATSDTASAATSTTSTAASSTSESSSGMPVGAIVGIIAGVVLVVVVVVVVVVKKKKG